VYRPKSLVDWFTVIGFVIIVWQLASKWRMLLFRRVANWWASRSRLKLLQRIRLLQAILNEIEPLPLLTPFEDVLLRGLAGLAAMLVIIPAMALALYEALSNAPLLDLPKREYLRQVSILVLAFIYLIIGVGMSNFIDTFRRDYRAFKKSL
jgi:hypothetical protein